MSDSDLLAQVGLYQLHRESATVPHACRSFAARRCKHVVLPARRSSPCRLRAAAMAVSVQRRSWSRAPPHELRGSIAASNWIGSTLGVTRHEVLDGRAKIASSAQTHSEGMSPVADEVRGEDSFHLVHRRSSRRISRLITFVLLDRGRLGLCPQRRPVASSASQIGPMCS